MPIHFDVKERFDSVDLLKLFNVRIDEYSYLTILEKLELLIELLSSLNIAKVLIIPNLKSYLNEKDLVELYKYSLYNNVNLIIFESRDWEKLKYENVLQIDDEFDEILK